MYTSAGVFLDVMDLVCSPSDTAATTFTEDVWHPSEAVAIFV
jgi:hypothetical protein